LGQKDGDKSIAFAIQHGKIAPEVVTVIDEARIIEVTGWTPAEIDGIDAERLMPYKIVWSKGVTTRKEAKELR